MLEPAVYTALVILVAFGLRALLPLIGIVLDEATYNALAAAIVTAVLAWLGLEVFRAGVRKYLPGLVKRGWVKQ